MRLTINGVDFELLGDPHRGRPFRNGVPLHRLGDREKMQRAELQASLADVKGVAAHICMGDLFDKAKVDNRVVLETAQDYLAAVRAHDGVDYVCLTGNHDEMRDRDFVSSFRLFTEIVQSEMFVVRSIPLQRYYGDEGQAFLVFIPWHPLKTAREMVDEHEKLIRGADAVFGHWDVDRRLEGTDNYIPAERFVELGVKMAVTGHDHVAREMTLSGLPVVVTGSMQPYSHSEDPDERLYVTETTAEALLTLNTVGADAYKDMCLRIIGEWDDEVPNCLQFKVVPEGTEEAAEALAQVQIAEFNMNDLWGQAFEGVDEDVTSALRARFAEMGGEEE